MILNIALSIHVFLVLVGFVYSYIHYLSLPSYFQQQATLSLNWFGKSGFVSLLILLYRIGG